MDFDCRFLKIEQNAFNETSSDNNSSYCIFSALYFVVRKPICFLRDLNMGHSFSFKCDIFAVFL